MKGTQETQSLRIKLTERMKGSTYYVLCKYFYPEDGKQEDMSADDKKRADEYDATHEEESSIKQQSYTEEKGKSLVKRYTNET